MPNVELVALDFPGHGMSSHKSRDGPPMLLSELTYYVAEAMQQLEWTKQHQDGDNNGCKFSLIGHSMGAAVGCLYSAAFPEHVDQLVLVEGGGPLARRAEDISQHVRK